MIKSLYKEGDKVRVIKRKGMAGDYRFIFTDFMNKQFGGKIMTISKVVPYGSDERYRCLDDSYCYYMKEDKDVNMWASSMFEPISKPISKNTSEPLQLKIKTKQIKFNFNN